MKILMVTPEYPPRCGGIGWYVYYLSQELALRGHIITILLRSVHPVTPYGPFQIKPVNTGKVPLFNAINLVKKAREHLKNDPHTIALVHSTPIGAWIRDVPTILVSHWCIAEGHKRFYRGAYDIKSLLHIIFNRLYVTVEKKSVQEANAVAVVSNQMKQEIFAHYRKTAVYVGNAVDSTVFLPSQSLNQRGVLLPSMLRAGKGIREAVEVIKRLRRNNCNIPFSFVGDGPMKRWLLKELKRSALRNIRVMDPVDHPGLRSVYRSNSIVFLPSYYEGLPTVALEAMACGLPVVATNTGGTKEAISDQETGFIHSILDLDGMADSVLRLDKNSDLRRQLGENGRKRVCAGFNWDIVVDRFERLIGSII